MFGPQQELIVSTALPVSCIIHYLQESRLAAKEHLLHAGLLAHMHITTNMHGRIERTWDSAGSLRSFRTLLIGLQMAVVAVTTTGVNCQTAARNSNTCTECI